MNLDDFKRWPVLGFGGQVDYQGPERVVPGSAILARNVQFDRRRARTRDGFVDAISRQMIGGPVTGFDVLRVVGDVRPDDYPIAFTQSGDLLLESPAGSGCFVPIPTPFPLPQNARMQTAEAYNTLLMAFSDGERGLCPPLRYNGLTGVVGPVSQNPVGARWVEGRFAQVGDVVTEPSGRWWRCTVPGFMGPEPTWPAGYGYFLTGEVWRQLLAVSPGDHAPDTIWEEWTPAFEIYLPAPDVSTSTTEAVSGTLPSGKDIYIRLAYANDETGEGPWSDPLVFENTAASSGVKVVFPGTVTGDRPTNSPPMPRWLAELNINTAAFFPLTLNAYAAMVAHGAAAPTIFYQISSDSLAAGVVVSSDPSTSPVANFQRPTVSTSPDPAFGGTVTFTNPGQAADTSGTTFAAGSALSSQTTIPGIPPAGPFPGQDPQVIIDIISSSAIWSGYAAPPGVIDSIYLFVDYSVIAGGSINTTTATIEYTLDNGATWVVIANLANLSRERTLFKVLLDNAQNFAHIQVRARNVGSNTVGDGDAGGTLYIYDTRVGTLTVAATAITGQILLRETASGSSLTAPPTFTGETGLRYAILIREDDTASLSPVDVAGAIPIKFTNGEPQRVAILPPGGDTTSALLVALTVSGSQQAGPYFDIAKSSPESPASSDTLSVERDGNGVVNAKVKNAIGFQAGHVVLVSDVGSGLDGTFTLAAVDPSINQLTWGQEGGGASGTTGKVEEQQNNLRSGADAPVTAFYLNFDDDFLSKSRDDTKLLTFMAAPNASDIAFLPTLKKVVYTDNDGRFNFSQTDDPGNIDSVGGTLSVEASKGGHGIAVREMTHGQIIAIKSNGGYQLNTSDVEPGKWNPERLWELHGPPTAFLLAIGTDFLVFGCESGAYMFAGADLQWISQEYTGTWEEIDWTASSKMWAAIEPTKKEVHFGMCLDDTGFPSDVLKMSYIGGWAFPEVRTRSGALITADDARKWSQDTVRARIARYVHRKVVAPSDCAGGDYSVILASRAGNHVELQFAPGQLPPVDIGDLLTVVIDSDVTFAGQFAVTALAPMEINPSLTYDQTAADALVYTGGVEVGRANTTSRVADLSKDKQINTKQLLYALSDSVPWKTFDLVTIRRDSHQVHAQFRSPGPPLGDWRNILIEGTDHFDGFHQGSAFVPVAGPPGIWETTWEDFSEPPHLEDAGQGTLSSTIPTARLAVPEPGRADDNGRGIDSQYQPSFTQDPKGGVLQFGGYRGHLRGSGTTNIRLVTEDPDDLLRGQTIDLAENAKLTHFTRLASDGDCIESEFGSPLLDNGKEPGAWFELVELNVYANSWRPSPE